MTGSGWDPGDGDARPPGWHPDPWYSGQHRLWTGQSWTGDTFPDGPDVPVEPVPGALSAYGPPPLTRSTAAPPPRWYGPQPAQPPVSGWPDDVHTEVLSAPLRRSLPRWALASLAVTVGFLIGLAAVYASTDHGSAAAAPPPAATLPPAAPPSPADPNAAVLQQLVVQPSDVPTADDVFVIQGGDRVAGQTTLDLCNGTYPSESLRTARLQDAVADRAGTTLLSTEAVLYRSPAATAQAFAELRSVAAHCPDRPVRSPVGEPTTTTTFGPAPDRGWPQVAGVQRLGFDLHSTDTSGQQDHSLAIYLRRGRALLAVYLPLSGGTVGVTVDGYSGAEQITNVFAHRLAQLPASVVNR